LEVEDCEFFNTVGINLYVRDFYIYNSFVVLCLSMYFLLDFILCLGVNTSAFGLFFSFNMAHCYPDLAGDVDVISDSEV